MLLVRKYLPDDTLVVVSAPTVHANDDLMRSLSFVARVFDFDLCNVLRATCLAQAGPVRRVPLVVCCVAVWSLLDGTDNGDGRLCGNTCPMLYARSSCNGLVTMTAVRSASISRACSVRRAQDVEVASSERSQYDSFSPLSACPYPQHL